MFYYDTKEIFVAPMLLLMK